MTTGFKGDTRAILSPKSDFFRYFTHADAADASAPADAAPASAPAAK